jgi:hypothetical protein
MLRGQAGQPVGRGLNFLFGYPWCRISRISSPRIAPVERPIVDLPAGGLAAAPLPGADDRVSEVAIVLVAAGDDDGPGPTIGGPSTRRKSAVATGTIVATIAIWTSTLEFCKPLGGSDKMGKVNPFRHRIALAQLDCGAYDHA